jgi:hypothetical protein
MHLLKMTGEYVRPLAVSLFFCGLMGCERKNDLAAEIRRLEPERIELRHKLELLEFRHSSKDQSDKLAELRQLGARADEHRKTISALRSERDELLAELKDSDQRIKEEVAMLRNQAQKRALNQSFAAIETRQGRIFNDVKVINVSDLGVQIHHRDGTARLGYDDLTDAQRSIFAIEADASLAARETERQHLQASAAIMAKAEKRQAMHASRPRETQERVTSTVRTEFPRSSAATNLAPTAASTGTLSKPPTTFGSGSIYRYHPSRYTYSDRPTAYRYYTPSYQQVPRYSPSCSGSDLRSFTDVIRQNR